MKSGYSIQGSGLGFHKDSTKRSELLKKNLFPTHLMDKVPAKAIIARLLFPLSIHY